jgi:hypothetical protein
MADQSRGFPSWLDGNLRIRQQYPFFAKDPKIGYSSINARAENRRQQSDAPRGNETTTLFGACYRVLRVAENRKQSQAALDD